MLNRHTISDTHFDFGPRYPPSLWDPTAPFPLVSSVPADFVNILERGPKHNIQITNLYSDLNQI